MGQSGTCPWTGMVWDIKNSLGQYPIPTLIETCIIACWIRLVKARRMSLKSANSDYFWGS